MKLCFNIFSLLINRIASLRWSPHLQEFPVGIAGKLHSIHINSLISDVTVEENIVQLPNGQFNAAVYFIKGINFGFNRLKSVSFLSFNCK